jgi:hypothetical protein
MRELRALGDPHFMGNGKARFRHGMRLCAVDHRWDVLNQRAAERDVEYLHAATNREDRKTGLGRRTDQRDLVLVPARL